MTLSHVSLYKRVMSFSSPVHFDGDIVLGLDGLPRYRCKLDLDIYIKSVSSWNGFALLLLCGLTDNANGLGTNVDFDKTRIDRLYRLQPTPTADDQTR